MTELTVGGISLGVTLDGGQTAFTAHVDDAVLTLSAEIEGIWTLNGQALRTLMRSGVSTLALENGAKRLELSTEPALTGTVYARLCAEGFVSSDYDYRIDGEDILVTVSGSAYRLSDAGELIPMEGD